MSDAGLQYPVMKKELNMKKHVLKAVSLLSAGLLACTLAVATPVLPVAASEGRDEKVFSFQARNITLKPGDTYTIFIDAYKQFRYFVVGKTSDDTFVTSDRALGRCWFTMHIGEDETADEINVYFYRLDDDGWYDTVTIHVDHSAQTASAEDTTTSEETTQTSEVVEPSSAPVIVGDSAIGKAEVLTGGQILYVTDEMGTGLAALGLTSDRTGAFQQMNVLGEDANGYLYVSLPYSDLSDGFTIQMSPEDRENLKAAGFTGLTIVENAQEIDL